MLIRAHLCHSRMQENDASYLLVARHIDADHVLQAKVEWKVREEEGHHEAPAGTVHMNADVPAILLIHLPCPTMKAMTVNMTYLLISQISYYTMHTTTALDSMSDTSRLSIS
jgi:hypothetical protein